MATAIVWMSGRGGETLADAAHDFFGAAGLRILRPSSQRSKRSVLAVNEAD